MSSLPVLWICGPPGVGKSTMAWAVYQRLAGSHPSIAYVDIDQLGMVLPAPAADPDHHRVKLDALSGVIGNAQALGAGALVVSGVLDSRRGAEVTRELPGITFCGLTVAPEVITARLATRGWPDPEIARALDELSELSEATFLHRHLDGTGHALSDLIAAGVAMITPSLGPTAGEVPDAEIVPEGHGLLITGPRAVGKSTVSWQLFMRSAESSTTGYADLAQLGFISAPGVRDRFQAANLATLWRVFHAAGATRMIMNGPVGDGALGALRRQLRGFTLEVVGLSADEAAYRRRIAARYDGGPAELAGDDLLGADLDHQSAVLAGALSEEARLRDRGWVDRVVDTRDLAAVAVADALES